MCMRCNAGNLFMRYMYMMCNTGNLFMGYMYIMCNTGNLFCFAVGVAVGVVVGVGRMRERATVAIGATTH